jgi:hypothetical protein
MKWADKYLRNHRFSRGHCIDRRISIDESDMKRGEVSVSNDEGEIVGDFGLVNG